MSSGGDDITISARGRRDPAPLRDADMCDGISRSLRASKESSTLSILISLPSSQRAVSLRRRAILSCASVIFLYNVTVL